jgi:hypothetical protein
MFNVTVSENGRLVDKIEFDEQNIVHCDGGVAMIHRDVMQSCGHNGIWYRVAYASGIVAERGALLNAMEAMTKEAIQRLRERLETGWAPQADEIDRPCRRWTLSIGSVILKKRERSCRSASPIRPSIASRARRAP